MTALRVVELFAGAGGFALGAEAAGLTHAALVEWDADACATLRLNRPDWPVRGPGPAGNVRHMYDLFDALKGEADVVVGGPPCQPFSTAGEQEGEEDPRDMWRHAVRAVRAIRPRAFLFENVKGLLAGKFAAYRRDVILGPLRRLGYDVRMSKPPLNAADYGVPQARERVITVGFKKGLGVQWEWPKPTHSKDVLLAAQYVDGSYWKEHGLPARGEPVELVEHVGRMRPPPLPRWRTVRDVVAPGASTGFELRHEKGIVEVHEPDVPAWTVTATKWNNKLLRTDGGCGLRYLTIPELAALQAFPEGWPFAGPEEEQMRQIGNAVPPPMAEALMRAVARALA